MNLPKLICNVCNINEALGVASSSIGPMSNAYCRRCLEENAEPFWMLVYLFYDVGHEGEGLAEHVAYYATFKDGKYITWNEFADFEHQNGYPNRPPPLNFL